MEHKPKNNGLWSYQFNCILMIVGVDDYSSGKEVAR